METPRIRELLIVFFLTQIIRMTGLFTIRGVSVGLLPWWSIPEYIFTVGYSCFDAGQLHFPKVLSGYFYDTLVRVRWTAISIRILGGRDGRGHTCCSAQFCASRAPRLPYVQGHMCGTGHSVCESIVFIWRSNRSPAECYSSGIHCDCHHPGNLFINFALTVHTHLTVQGSHYGQKGVWDCLLAMPKFVEHTFLYDLWFHQWIATM